MVYHIKCSPGTGGRVEVWMKGVQVVSYCSTAFKDGESFIYDKFGLYRNRLKEQMSTYFDNYTLGERFSAVDPSRFDQPRIKSVDAAGVQSLPLRGQKRQPHWFSSQRSPSFSCTFLTV